MKGWREDFQEPFLFFCVGVGRSLAHRKKGSKKERKTKIVQRSKSRNSTVVAVAAFSDYYADNQSFDHWVRPLLSPALAAALSTAGSQEKSAIHSLTTIPTVMESRAKVTPKESELRAWTPQPRMW